MGLLIKNANIINEGKIFKADLLVEGEIIKKIAEASSIDESINQVIDANGKYLLPGVIDDHVHFREPGLTHKGDIEEGSRAAVAGGITSFMDMPNVKPQTTTLELLEEKFNIASERSLANYSFYLGATNSNIEEIRNADPKKVCGIKLFMGSSTGNMLVEKEEQLAKIFKDSPMLIATHCEDTSTIIKNTREYKEKYGDDIPVEFHPAIRSAKACYDSTSLAIKLAKKFNSRLHVLHLTTDIETDLFDNKPRKDKRITAEVCVHHLWFNESAYKKKGNFARWNPAIKTESDRKALIEALKDGRIDVIATDHAPHTVEEKTGPYTKSASGGPSIQHSLVIMLELVKKGEITLEEVVDKMCHAPADLYNIEKRGYIKEGYYADLCLISKEDWTVKKENILYKCGWAPFEGTTFSNIVDTTIVNGNIVYNKGSFNTRNKGKRLLFNR